MNRQIRQLAVGLMACYVVLFATLNYWQVAQEEELNANVENTRAVRREFNKPRARSSPPTASSPPSRFRTPTPTPNSIASAPTRPATCCRTSPATSRSASDRPRSSGRTATCSPATRPNSRSVRSATSCRARSTTRARCSWRSATTCSRSPSSPSVVAPARSWCWTSPPARCGRCTATRRTTRTRSSRCRSRTRRKRSSTSRTRPAIRCSPAPTSSGSCPARRSR